MVQEHSNKPGFRVATIPSRLALAVCNLPKYPVPTRISRTSSRFPDLVSERGAGSYSYRSSLCNVRCPAKPNSMTKPQLPVGRLLRPGIRTPIGGSGSRRPCAATLISGKVSARRDSKVTKPQEPRLGTLPNSPQDRYLAWARNGTALPLPLAPAISGSSIRDGRGNRTKPPLITQHSTRTSTPHGRLHANQVWSHSNTRGTWHVSAMALARSPTPGLRNSRRVVPVVTVPTVY
ncbi:uncharacterized protein B0T15DRAFT_309712 [Chaetomium strumarium]|uniref:Uncharacterized protein n=1 Tax=Chaetomium strumarium TaxID=1170767 RepID=A0AAJ0GMN9_9PEZI|nr:hypothetical protein B0T15DRAFT_309712 [Chaetomium strumarium]